MHVCQKDLNLTMIWIHCSHLHAGYPKRENRSNFKLPMVYPFVPIQIQWWCSDPCLRFHAWMVNFLWGCVTLTSLPLKSRKLWMNTNLAYQSYPRFMDPLVGGDYPVNMRRLVGNHLPRFTKEQSKLVKGAFDFIGINYYTTYYAESLPPSNGLNNSYNTDYLANVSGE